MTLTASRTRHFAQALLLFLPALAAILLYLPALKFGKVWDDFQLFASLEGARDPAAWPHMLARSLPFAENYFRPLVMFTYMLEVYAKASNAASHLTNILLHAANSVLLVLLAWRVWPPLRYRATAAVFIGLAYAVAPPLSEVAIWVSGRFDLMMVSFVLLGLLADTLERSAATRAALVGLAFAIALLCKEMAIVMALAVPALRLARSGLGLRAFLFAREQLVLYAGLAAGLGVYLALRIATLGYLMQPVAEMAQMPLGGTLNRILLIGMSFAGYLHMLLLPLANVQPLHFTTFPIGVTNPLAWAGLLEMALAAVLVAWLYRRARWRFFACGLGIALASLAPVLHFKPVQMVMGNMWMADRFLALPLALFLLALGPLFALVDQPRLLRLAGSVALAWLLLAALVTRSIVPLWQDELSLWHWLTEDVPECSPCHTNFSANLLGQGMWQNALVEAERAVRTAELPWHRGAAHKMRAQVLTTMSRHEEALAEVDLALALAPSRKLQLLRAGLLLQLGRDTAAQAALEDLARAGEEDATVTAMLAELQRRRQAPK